MNPPLQPLCDFRHELRKFLHFSEEASAKSHLHIQQYQLLLQIAGAPESPTIGYLAGRLLLRHHTVVELSKRCAEAGLLRRTRGEDRRVVFLHLTSSGKRVLGKIAAAHARELKVLAPRLIQSLLRIQIATKKK